MKEGGSFDALVLAPMAGVTDAVFRLLCAGQGARLTHTEMVSAKGYTLSGGGNRQAQALLQVLPGSGPTVLQLFGSDPVFFVDAAQRLLSEHPHFVGIDLNMGCPAPKITGSGEGSALMRTPDLAAKIIRATVDAVRVPVSVKMRLGWDEQQRNAVSFAQMAQQQGAHHLCVHGRTRMQFYAGQADWDAIARVKESVSIPVYGNGDIFSAEDALRMREATGCDGVMVARGAMGNPWIFHQIREALAGRTAPLPGATDRISMAVRHAQMLIAELGEWLGIREMRKHVAWYLKGLRGASQIRQQINTLESFDALSKCLQDYLDDLSRSGE